MDAIKGNLQENYYSYFENCSDIEQNIENIINKLYEKYKSKVYILIDNFDSPLFSAMNLPYLNDMIDLYKKLLPKSLAYNEKIQKIILCGRY